MSWQHFVLARDDSAAGRNAERVGIGLAARCDARYTVLTVIPSPSAELVLANGSVTARPVENTDGVIVTHGVVNIEICRFAEQEHADLIVLGRKARSGLTRRMLGDTADAVARRSLVPTLHVPPGADRFASMLVALDGSERGLSVLRETISLAERLGMELHVVTVEQEFMGKSTTLAEVNPTGRTDRLIKTISAMGLPLPLLVRHGDPVTALVGVARELGTDILVVGYRRGGPPAVLEAGSVARRLIHVAPCAVLAMPL